MLTHHGKPYVAFLSTPSARRATVHLESAAGSAGQISIHALREEGDDGELTFIKPCF